MRAHHLASRKRNASGCLMQQTRASHRITHQARLMRAFLNTDRILSSVGIKLAVQTSVLSPRWRYLWTSLPCLNFSSEDFRTLPEFSNFVTHVLSVLSERNDKTERKDQTEVSSAKLSFRGMASQAFVKRILDYVFSHNVKQLTVSCLPDKSQFEFPLSLFSSQSLEHLTIAGHSCASSVCLTSTWELTSLTTLLIEYIEFNDEVTAEDTGIFSKCANLKKLVLKGCGLTGSNCLDICHPGLSDLTLENGYFSINVDAPQLKNLTVSYCKGLHLISAPELVSLRFEDWQSEWLKFSSCGLCSLENVDLCIIISRSYNPNKPDARTTFDQLQQLHSVKYLTLNVEIFQLLSPLMELISSQPSPFVNLKSLKVYPHKFHVEVPGTIPPEVKKYLQDGSPSATFTEVSYEEMRALENVELLLKHMAELREMLKHEKANIDMAELREMLKHEKANIDLDRVTTPMECHELVMHEQDKMQISKREAMKQIDSCWKDLKALIKHGEAKTSDITLMLCDIEQLLTELPASKRAQIEKSLSRLFTEAEAVMNAIMNSVKIQEKQSRLSIYFHDIAAKPSF